MSCQSDVNPKWKYAIDTNLCPCCGKIIMQEEIKKLLTTLSDSIEGLLKYPEYLNDWLFLRFNFVPAYKIQILEKQVEELKLKLSENRITDKDCIESVDKINNEVNEVNEVNEDSIDSVDKKEVNESTLISVQNEKITNEFFKRSNADKIVKNSKNIKDLVSRIKNSSIQDTMENSSNITEYIEPEITSSLDTSDDLDHIPDSVLAFANDAKDFVSSGYNKKDLDKLRELQEKSRGARQRMLSGANKGGFSR
jgi:hypothetical protein